MGSFSYLTVADYPIFDKKNGYYEELTNSLFQPSDFICEKRKYSSRNKTFWGDVYENEKGVFEFKGFKQTVKVCKQRLGIYGTSYKKAKADFTKAKKLARQDGFYSFNLNGFTYENYLREIKAIITSKEKKYDELNTNFRDSLITGDLRIWGQAIDCYLYSILSVLPDNEVVEYDFTDIISGGWVNLSQAKLVDYEKIIILTEGKTDVEFISQSIAVLYPHLKDYYHFIDFDEYKVESNASALVKLVTSFAAAKIKHPIIALFDNDTTGLMEMKNLISKKLPSNIKVLRYPDIILAKKYPTRGPTGIKRMNINGFACGIEMYLGQEILKKNNELLPIQWKGFNDKEKKYQGEIVEKQLVQDAFRKKIKNSDLTQMTDMDLLLNEIFNAYK